LFVELNLFWKVIFILAFIAGFVSSMGTGMGGTARAMKIWTQPSQRASSCL
jgi:hypothetical protein